MEKELSGFGIRINGHYVLSCTIKDTHVLEIPTTV